MKLTLTSKAKTLKILKDKLSHAKVLPQIAFRALDYKENKTNLLNLCMECFNTTLIIRSSSHSEDTLTTSNAGSFKSVLHVKPQIETIDKAIISVIDSLGDLLENDEIFIQPMLCDVTMSGVIFTADLDTLSPYYIVNYDDISGSTTSVTGGTSNNLKTFVTCKSAKQIVDKRLELLINTAYECETIFHNTFLDIEFAFSNNELYILQVRAIVTHNKMDLSKLNLTDSLDKVYTKIHNLTARHPKLLGKKSIFGVMPDWNPAEIIGIKPKKLALSLYKELITDEIWAYQRDNYGYRNLRSFPLLISFLGVPFIDVRVSFNSFIPKSLNDDIASKLVDYYLDELSAHTSHHDKIEFKIVYSCYFFGIANKLSILENKNFNKNEIKRIEFSLLELTNQVIDRHNGLYKKDILKIEKLKTAYDEVVNSSLSLVEKIYWLMEDCKRYGTLPFAGVARAAFIAIQFLNSMVDEKILTLHEYNAFLNSLNTISKQLHKDKDTLSKEEFLNIYGHLRPGTYEITSYRYDESYDTYFSSQKNTIQDITFTFSKLQKSKIKQLLAENGLHSEVEDFILFLKEAIEGREYLKFIFTKHLSKILKYIEELGSNHGISREDLAHLDIQIVLNLYATLNHLDIQDILKSNIENNKKFHEYTKAVKLPALILHEKDVYQFFLEKNEPNFITLKSIESYVAKEEASCTVDLKNKIVCIKSADPGYDYVFTKKISGLITCYGGANSHMAIRCAELGIPAIIGCGEHNFALYQKANILCIDALNKQVKILS